MRKISLRIVDATLRPLKKTVGVMMRLRTTNMSTRINISEKKEMSEKKRVIRDLKDSKRKASDTRDDLRSFYLKDLKII